MLEELVKNLKAAQEAIEEFKDGFQYRVLVFGMIWQDCVNENYCNNLYSLMEALNSTYDERYYHKIFTNNPNLNLEKNTEVFYHKNPFKMEFVMGKPIEPVLSLEQYKLELSTGIKHVVCECGIYSLATMCIDCANKQASYEMPEDEHPYDRSAVLKNDDIWEDDIWK